MPQLERVRLAPSADAVALVKPQFELALPEPPTSRRARATALRAACAGFEQAGWHVCGAIESPHPGRRGAVEYLLHAVRRPRPGETAAESK